MYLVALWFNHEDSPGSQPDLIQWSDGRPASLSDYDTHINATSQLIWDDPRWMALRLYPDITGTVKWDPLQRRWKVEGEKIGYFWLEGLTEKSTDMDIIMELSLYPIDYRCTVIRSEQSTEAVEAADR